MQCSRKFIFRIFTIAFPFSNHFPKSHKIIGSRVFSLLRGSFCKREYPNFRAWQIHHRHRWDYRGQRRNPPPPLFSRIKFNKKKRTKGKKTKETVREFLMLLQILRCKMKRNINFKYNNARKCFLGMFRTHPAIENTS